MIAAVGQQMNLGCRAAGIVEDAHRSFFLGGSNSARSGFGGVGKDGTAQLGHALL
jgi:hypothetical protein